MSRHWLAVTIVCTTDDLIAVVCTLSSGINMYQFIQWAKEWVYVLFKKIKLQCPKRETHPLSLSCIHTVWWNRYITTDCAGIAYYGLFKRLSAKNKSMVSLFLFVYVLLYTVFFFLLSRETHIPANDIKRSHNSRSGDTWRSISKPTGHYFTPNATTSGTYAAHRAPRSEQKSQQRKRFSLASSLTFPPPRGAAGRPKKKYRLLSVIPVRI